ncbi:NACHT domain-containing protein [Marinobacter algicola]|uniref:NACHT domain-containing protein n=1 Tax=Marinobacter algicola DG893 TaxID=443152 RepID=A6EXL7_9GAMM|nr:NACHT domain-containing protein [Marinobacter algicola]EDM48905.1 hypothetical protein MDG893_03060 [Marinobacter algicola DG893]
MDAILEIMELIFNNELAGPLLAILSSSTAALIIFPSFYKKYHSKYRLLDSIAYAYIIIIKSLPSRGSAQELKRNISNLSPIKISIDHNKIDESQAEKLNSLNFPEKIYVRPDVKKTSPYDLDSEHHMMSLREDIDIVEDHEASIDPLLSLLEKSSKKIVFLRGAAGFGKSNLCAYVANYFSNEASEVFETIYSIDATDIDNSITEIGNGSLIDFLIFNNKEYRLPITIERCLEYKASRRRVNRKLISWNKIYKTTSARCLLVIDGLDELKDLNRRNMILDFTNQHVPLSRWRVLITGRPSSFREWNRVPSGHSDFFELLPFRENQIEELSFNLHRLFSPSKNKIASRIETRDFVRRITNNTTIELASNPLFLTLMVQLDSDNKQLPNNKPELIKEIIKEIIERRSTGVGEKFKDRMQDILSYMAYLTICDSSKLDIKKLVNKKIETNKPECQHQINDYWDVVSFFDKSGLIIRDDNIKFRFVNRCYLEYLCAEHLFSSLNDENFKETIELSLSHEYSEIFYYLTYHINDPDKVFSYLTENIDTNEKSIKSCIDLFCFSQTTERNGLSRENTENLSLYIEKIKNDDKSKYSEIKLYLKLNLLKFSDPLSKRPLRFNESIPLIRLNKKNKSENGLLVGLRPSQIKSLLDNINSIYADSRGYFTLPSFEMAKNTIYDDSVLFHEKSFFIYNSNLDIFNDIKKKIRGNSDKIISKLFIKINKTNPLTKPFIESIDQVIDLVFEIWNPSILITNNERNFSKDLNSNCLDLCEQKFHIIVNNFFSDPTFRAKLQRDHSITTMLLGNNFKEINPDATRNFNNIFEDLTEIEFQGIAEIESLIVENLISIFVSLQSNSGVNFFYKSILCLSRLFTIHSIQSDLVPNWGVIRIAYVPNTRLSKGPSSSASKNEPRSKIELLLDE